MGERRAIHVDTDFAGDPDDACALAMLLGSPDADVIAVTTALEDDGRRHDGVRAVLALAGRPDVPSAAGLDRTLTGQRFSCTWDDPRHWPAVPARVASPPGAALDLLAGSIDSGAIVLAIGGFTNLAALELACPGSLADARVVAMAGWIDPAPDGYPPWGPAFDFNTQCDTRAALVVAAACPALTIVPLPVAMRATLRLGHLDRLRAAGPVGELLARQSETHRATSRFEELAQQHPGFPVDLVNVHWDPVAAGVALGWDCVAVGPAELVAREEGGVVRFSDTGGAGAGAIACGIEARSFEDRWMRCVERLGR